MHSYTAFDNFNGSSYWLDVDRSGGMLYILTKNLREIDTYMMRGEMATLLRNWRRDPYMEVERFRDDK